MLSVIGRWEAGVAGRERVCEQGGGGERCRRAIRIVGRCLRARCREIGGRLCGMWYGGVTVVLYGSWWCRVWRWILRL